MINSSTPLQERCIVLSSSEGLDIVERVKAQLGDALAVEVWTDVFSLNTSALDELVQRASFYDFAVVVLTADDRAVVRKKLHRTPRDNVLFQLGLFVGSIGKRRTFFLAETGVRIPTDWAGI